MPFEAEQHAVPPGRVCCFAGISTHFKKFIFHTSRSLVFTLQEVSSQLCQSTNLTKRQQKTDCCKNNNPFLFANPLRQMPKSFLNQNFLMITRRVYGVFFLFITILFIFLNTLYADRLPRNMNIRIG